jgi:hypothetical protein
LILLVVKRSVLRILSENGTVSEGIWNVNGWRKRNRRLRLRGCECGCILWFVLVGERLSPEKVWVGRSKGRRWRLNVC